MESFIPGVISPAVALPAIQTFADAASYTQAVAPYTGQLRAFSYNFFASIGDASELQRLYLSTNPLISAFAFSIALAPIFLVVSEINKNYSQVDRCWSILPTIYNLHYTVWAHLAGVPAKRLDFLLAFSLIWSTRLTFNYWRKGGYSVGSEDYRWPILREYIPPALFFVFNVAFISLAQSVLLFLVTSPTYIILLCGRLQGNILTIADWAFFGGLVGLVALTALSDEQQWIFHQAKQAYQKTARPPEEWDPTILDLGFNTIGLWGYSRHPNFAAEQAIWVTLYLWSVSATWRDDDHKLPNRADGHHVPTSDDSKTGLLANYTIAGALGYLALFQASTWFTEMVTGWKYEGYKEYRRRVGRFVPRISSLWKGGVTAEELILTTGGPARSTRSRGRASMGKAEGRKMLDGAAEKEKSGSVKAASGSGRRKVSEGVTTRRRS